MLDLSPDKLMMLAVVALVVLGPNRLPQAARSMGRLLGQVRAMSSSLQSEVREALHDPEDAIGSALAEFRPGEFRPSQVRRTVRRAVTDTLAPAALLPSARTPQATNPTSGPAGGPPSPGPPAPDDPAFN